MSTTLITTRRRPQSTTSTSSRRAPATSTSSQRATGTSTKQRKPSATSTSLRIASSSPTALPTNLASDFSFIQLGTNAPVPSVTNSLNQPSLVDTSKGPTETCSTDSDCASGKACSSARCVTMGGAAPLGGSGAEPTSRLTPGSAIGIGVGVVGMVVLMIAAGYWFWRIRARRPRTHTIEAPSHTRQRSASNATDQRTLVASLPNSPQNAAFSQQHTMDPGLFARALAFNEKKEKPDNKRSGSMEKHARSSTEKALPPRPTPHPLMEHPLPPPPTKAKSYAVNVNINKSMILDDELINAVSSLRGNDTPRSGTPTRDRAPRYKFEEYIPPTAAPPSISISHATPTTEKRNSEYELSQLPNRRRSVDSVSVADDSSNGGDSEPPSPVRETLSKLESKPPQLPLPDLPPPSPSFSFRSYDWYQDIIGDQPNGEPITPTVPSRNPARTPTESTFPKPLSLSPKKAQSAMRHSSLIPEPLSPGAPPAASGLLLHPSSTVLPSPTNPNYRLSPTVYTPPRQQSPIPPTAPRRASARASTMTTATRATHDSRSWLPDDGLYLAEEGDEYAEYKTFHRPSEDSRPTSYSPLT